LAYFEEMMNKHVLLRQSLLARTLKSLGLAVALLPALFVVYQGTLLAEPRIVGGEDAAVGELPWQVLVLPGPNLCGGTLIDTEWVLTAAHCVVDDSNTPLAPADVQVIAGEYDLDQVDGDEQERGVVGIVVHPDYDPNAGDNDIALLHLAAPVVPGPSVATIALLFSPANDALAPPGTSALVSGWGATSEGGEIAYILQKVRLPLVSNAVCSQAYGGGITANMLCAGFEAGGKDSCQGDSGGPLVVPDGSGWRLAGVVSFGSGCAQPGLYGVYARVSQYTGWISTYVAAITQPPLLPPEEINAYLYLPFAGGM
jgi:secreted trypsin-like serine protease